MSAEFDKFVSAVTKSREHAGSCNACHRHPRFDSSAHHDVIEVSLGTGNSVGFRVCVDCASVLLEKLKAERDRIKTPAGLNTCYLGTIGRKEECPWHAGEGCPHPRCSCSTL